MTTPSTNLTNGLIRCEIRKQWEATWETPRESRLKDRKTLSAYQNCETVCFLCTRCPRVREKACWPVKNAKRVVLQLCCRHGHWVVHKVTCLASSTWRKEHDEVRRQLRDAIEGSLYFMLANKGQYIPPAVLFIDRLTLKRAWIISLSSPNHYHKDRKCAQSSKSIDYQPTQGNYPH